MDQQARLMVQMSIILDVQAKKAEQDTEREKKRVGKRGARNKGA